MLFPSLLTGFVVAAGMSRGLSCAGDVVVHSASAGETVARHKFQYTLSEQQAVPVAVALNSISFCRPCADLQSHMQRPWRWLVFIHCLAVLGAQYALFNETHCSAADVKGMRVTFRLTSVPPGWWQPNLRNDLAAALSTYQYRFVSRSFATVC